MSRWRHWLRSPGFGYKPSSATALLGGSRQITLCPCASVSPSDKFRGREEVDQSDDLDLATKETEFWLCHPPMGSVTPARSLDTSELHFSTEGHLSSASWPATQAWAWVPIALPLSHPPSHLSFLVGNKPE